MLRLAADENFNNNIVRGLLHRQPELDIVRIQDVGLSGADDPTPSTLTSAFEQANPCLGYLKPAEMFRSVALLRISCCWRHAAWTGNGKARCDICPCRGRGNRHPSPC